MRKHYPSIFYFFCFSLLSVSTWAQPGQLTVSKVSSMPNMPSPYMMRDWKNVAFRYDSTIYNLSATGQYLPLMHLKSSGTNYPSIQPILLDSYVGAPGGGSAGGAEAEAVNIIPSVVGASLVGINKSSQNGHDWVQSVKDFYNKQNGQNVYLNGSSAGSGSDWWYDMMPNIFFYQLYTQYPTSQDFGDQFVTIADQWLSAVKAMGGSTIPWTVPQMNYRGFNLATMKPATGGVTEPESAGTIAWILYHAYVKTGDKKYLDGAQLAISFLSGLTANPAYEIQLPYGTFIAAKMNAELGTTYNVQKMVNWSFDQSSKRNWGTIVGTWGDGTTGPTDVSGLVGEVDNPNTGYAFTMNGYQQASALVPMVKYDKRFAHDIAKWTLNVANASRLFYSKYIPQTHQDDFTWASANDPHSVIAYEALKQTNNGTLLYATGDAERGGWAATNLGLYGSSHVGYLGAIVQSTDVDGILLLDVNKTDFFGPKPFPSYLVYNPYGITKQVTLPLGAGNYDIYDAISETKVKTGVTGNVLLSLPANAVNLLVYLPAGTVTTAQNGKLMAGNNVVDYSYGYNFAGHLRIRSLAAADTTVGFGQNVKVYSSVENKTGPATYNWYVNGALIASQPDSTLQWTVPSVAGPAYLVLKVTSGASSVKDSIQFNILDHLPYPPKVTGITADSTHYYLGSNATLVCHVDPSETGPLTYLWTVPSGGSIISINGATLKWTLPQGEGMFNVSCKVSHADGTSTTVTYGVLVKTHANGKTGPVAYFPLDGNTKDYSGNGHDATSSGVVPTADERGGANLAYYFNNATDIIDVPNASTLNFQNQITLSFWVKLSQVYEESFVLSHGSYEERWKVSVTPDQHMRWTIKTSTSTTDLDSSIPLVLNTFYHFTVVYTGYSMEMYINGVMDSYNATTGLMSTTAKDITFGRKDATTLRYELHGTLDEVRIYDKGLSPDEIFTLKSLWNSDVVTGLEEKPHSIEVYPNPAHGSLKITGVEQSIVSVDLLDMTGRKIQSGFRYEGPGQPVSVEYATEFKGMMLVRIETVGKVTYKKIIAY